jgi:hypothetical protein
MHAEVRALPMVSTSVRRPQVVAFPSKSDGLFVPESLIFRSDSNGEDLAGYAGAGLYDSITMDQTVTRKVDYGSDRYMHSQDGTRGCTTLSHRCTFGMARLISHNNTRHNQMCSCCCGGLQCKMRHLDCLVSFAGF